MLRLRFAGSSIDCQNQNVGGWHALKGRGSSQTTATTPFQGVPPSDRSDIVNLRLNSGCPQGGSYSSGPNYGTGLGQWQAIRRVIIRDSVEHHSPIFSDQKIATVPAPLVENVT